MATNNFYKKALEAFGTAQIDVLGDDLRVLLIDTAFYTADFNTDEFVADIPPSAINAIRSGPLTNKAFPLGVFSADDVALVGVTGPSIEALVIIKWTGSDATSRLILYIDQAKGTLPVSLGGNVDIEWDTPGIFALSQVP
jgi:hypothetical protein